MPRAAALSPDERRQAIVDVVVPLLIEHGRAVTTRQIAEGAGIAEGTIFRVFESKDELIDAALQQAFDPRGFIAGLEEIDTDQPLHERLLDLVRLLQARFTEIFALMSAVGMVAPPAPVAEEMDRWREKSHQLLLGLVTPDAGELRVDPDHLLHVLRMLTFSASHAEISDHHILTPDQIVDIVLYGACRHTTPTDTKD